MSRALWAAAVVLLSSLAVPVATAQVVVRERVEVAGPAGAAAAGLREGTGLYRLTLSFYDAYATCDVAKGQEDCEIDLSGIAVGATGTRPDGTPFEALVEVAPFFEVAERFVSAGRTTYGRNCRYGSNERGWRYYDPVPHGSVDLGEVVGAPVLTTTFADESYHRDLTASQSRSFHTNRWGVLRYGYPFCDNEPHYGVYTGLGLVEILADNGVVVTATPGQLRQGPYSRSRLAVHLREDGVERPVPTGTALTLMVTGGADAVSLYDPSLGEATDRLAGVPVERVLDGSVYAIADGPVRGQPTSARVVVEVPDDDGPRRGVVSVPVLAVGYQVAVTPGAVGPGAEAAVGVQAADAEGPVSIDPGLAVTVRVYRADGEADVPGVLRDRTTGAEGTALTTTYGALATGAVVFAADSDADAQARLAAPEPSTKPDSATVADRLIREQILGWARADAVVPGPIAPTALETGPGTDASPVPGDASSVWSGVDEDTPEDDAEGTAPAAHPAERVAPAAFASADGPVRLRLWVQTGGTSGPYRVYGYTEFEVTGSAPTDLGADSDHDGRVTAADDAVESVPGRVGALVRLNDDDDDGDGVLDRADDEVANEDDLTALALGLPDGLAAREPDREVALVFDGPADRVRLWPSPVKVGAPLPLPYRVAAGAAPDSVYVEGLTWASATDAFRLALAGDPTSADTVRVYVGPTSLSAPSQAAAGSSPMAVVQGLPAGTAVVFRTFEGGALRASEATAANARGVAAYEIPTGGAGRKRTVTASADGGDLVLEAAPMEVVAGAPTSVTLRSPDPDGGWVADLVSERTVEATVLDAGGSPVADGTLVSFEARGSGGDFVTAISAGTVGGVARAPLRASGGRAVTVVATASPVRSAPLALEAAPVEMALSFGRRVLDVAAREVTEAVLETNASPGSVVRWFLSNGRDGLPEATETTVGPDGRATLEVASGGGRPGLAFLSAAVGARVVADTLRYTSSTPLWTEVRVGHIAGDVTRGGIVETARSFAVPAALRADPNTSLGATVDLRPARAYVAADAEVVLHGRPNQRYRFRVTEGGRYARVSLVRLGGGTVVEVGRAGTFVTDATGRATVTLTSTGAYDGRAWAPVDMVFTEVGNGGRGRGGASAAMAMAGPPREAGARIFVVDRKYVSQALHDMGVRYADEAAVLFGDQPTSAAGYRAYLEGSLGGNPTTRFYAVARNERRRTESYLDLFSLGAWSRHRPTWLPDEGVEPADDLELAMQALGLLAENSEEIRLAIELAEASGVADPVSRGVHRFLVEMEARVDTEALAEVTARLAAIAAFTREDIGPGGVSGGVVRSALDDLLECVLAQVAEEGQCVPALDAFTLALSERPGFVRFAEQAFTTPAGYADGKTAFNALGEAYADAADALARDETRQGVAERVARQWTHLLATEPLLARDLAADPETVLRARQLAEAMGDATLAGADVAAVVALGERVFPEGPDGPVYSRADFARTLAAVADGARSAAAIQQVGNQLRAIMAQREGPAYELMVGGALAEAVARTGARPDLYLGADIEEPAVPFADGSVNDVSTDIDVYLDGEIMEVKASPRNLEEKTRRDDYDAGTHSQVERLFALAHHFELDAVGLVSSVPFGDTRLARGGKTREKLDQILRHYPGITATYYHVDRSGEAADAEVIPPSTPPGR